MAGALTRLPSRSAAVPWFARPSTGGGLAPVVPPASEAGPLPPGSTGRPAPQTGHPHRLRQSLRITADLGRELFAGAELGDVFSFASLLDTSPVVVTQHPAHVRSFFTADPEIAPTLAGESPLRPVVGLSVLTALGEQHRRRRRLMMPSFHGEAIARYREEIREATARHLDRWRTGSPFALTDTTHAITLDVIMAGVFGIDQILLLHHRADLYPDPFRFAPERFVGRKPGAHEWVPFGGGTRRCLGAALAMEELRIVVPEIARRADLVVDDPAPERPISRNVTMIPARGGRVRATSLHP